MDRRKVLDCEVLPTERDFRPSQHNFKVLIFTRGKWDGGSHQRTTFAYDCEHLLHLLHNLGPRHCKFPAKICVNELIISSYLLSIR